MIEGFKFRVTVCDLEGTVMDDFWAVIPANTQLRAAEKVRGQLIAYDIFDTKEEMEEEIDAQKTPPTGEAGGAS